MSNLQSLDIRRRSATTTQSPSQRESIEVAKLIDVSRASAASLPGRRA